MRVSARARALWGYVCFSKESWMVKEIVKLKNKSVFFTRCAFPSLRFGND